MSENRRSFLKKAAQLSAVSLLPLSALAEKSTRIPYLNLAKASLGDENFWNMLRMQFPLDTKKISLLSD